jgi:hypothetical protein
MVIISSLGRDTIYAAAVNASQKGPQKLLVTLWRVKVSFAFVLRDRPLLPMADLGG